MLSPFWLFLIIGVALVAAEMVLFQFSTFWIFFIGLGALVAAGYAWISGDVTYTATVAVFLASSVAITAILFAPMRRWQNQPSAMEGNDAVGQTVVVEKAISPGNTGTVSWSGSDWQAVLAPGVNETIAEGASATVVSIQGIELSIKPLTA